MFERGFCMVDGRIAVGRLVRYINKDSFYGKHYYLLFFFVIIIESNLVGSLAVFVFNFKFNLINHY